jgi:hypothetical protein
MTTFAAGQKLTAASLEMATVSIQGTSTVGSTTSTTYTSSLTTTGGITLAAVASAAGKLKITVGAMLSNGTTGTFNYMAYALSGAGTYTESDADAAEVGVQDIGNYWCEKTTVRTGLIAFGSYTITGRFRCSGGTMGVFNRLIVAQPVI